MINIPLIGVAAALVLCAVFAKIWARGPEKVSKSEKAEIMKQLLAKSDGEVIPAKTPAARSRTPVATQSKPSSIGPRQKPQPAIPVARSSK